MKSSTCDFPYFSFQNFKGRGISYQGKLPTMHFGVVDSVAFFRRGEIQN